MSAKGRESTPPTPPAREPTLTGMPTGGASRGGQAVPTGIHVSVEAMTDTGLVREHNEDNFLVADLRAHRHMTAADDAHSDAGVGDEGFLLAVCDGMGGAAAGEVASQMAVDALFEVMDRDGISVDRDAFARRLVGAVEEAGNRIYSAAKMDRSRRGMGTTATVAGLRDKVLFVGQVGDSRAYVLRRGELVQITKDQSLVNQLVEAGQLTEEEAEGFEHSNIILQALGTTEDVQVDLTFLELRRRDVLMLCSDGLSGLVHAETIKDTLANAPDLRQACESLVELANAGGGHDNVTVVCASFDGTDLDEPEDPEVVRPAYQQYPLPAETADPTPPPRRTAIKSSAPKPGADVKRSLVGAEAAGAVAVDGAAGRRRFAPEDAPEVPVRAFPWWWIAVGVVLVLVMGAVLLANAASDGGGEAGEGTPVTVSAERPVAAPDRSPAAPEPLPEAVGAPDGPEPVTVVVRTDIDGAQVVVDGQAEGPLRDGMVLRLRPGRRHLVARSDGSELAETEVLVAPGEPVEVSLALPRGIGAAARVDPGAGNAAARGRRGPGAGDGDAVDRASDAEAAAARRSRRAERRRRRAAGGSPDDAAPAAPASPREAEPRAVSAPRQESGTTGGPTTDPAPSPGPASGGLRLSPPPAP